MADLNQKHILVTGGGAPGAAGILNALKGHYRLSSCDAQPQVIGKIIADQFFTVPHGSAPNYIEELLSSAIKHEIDLILPITTAELLPLSKAKERFEQHGIHVMVGEAEILSIANNKGALYQMLDSKGVALPNYRVAHSVQEFDRALDALSIEDEPLIFKPCEANGSRGFRIIDPSSNPFDLWLKQKPNNAYISRKDSLDLFGKEQFVPLLVSDYLEGEEYSVDCIIVEGKAKLLIPRKRIKINNGISVEGQIENNPEVIAYCQAIIQHLNWHGPLGIQLKFSKGQPFLLEINPRLQGSSTACIGAGINLPLLCAQLAFKHEIDWEQQNRQIVWGKHFYRYYQEAYSL